MTDYVEMIYENDLQIATIEEFLADLKTQMNMLLYSKSPERLESMKGYKRVTEIIEEILKDANENFTGDIDILQPIIDALYEASENGNVDNPFTNSISHSIFMLSTIVSNHAQKIMLDNSFKGAMEELSKMNEMIEDDRYYNRKPCQSLSAAFAECFEDDFDN